MTDQHRAFREIAIENCRAERARLMDDIAEMESGRFRLQRSTMEGWLDISAEWTAKLRDRVESLDRVITVYEQDIKVGGF